MNLALARTVLWAGFAAMTLTAAVLWSACAAVLMFVAIYAQTEFVGVFSASYVASCAGLLYAWWLWSHPTRSRDKLILAAGVSIWLLCLFGVGAGVVSWTM